MKVSILFMTYNHEQFVSHAIKAAFSQDYYNFEIVICDDGSNDQTLDIIERELLLRPPNISVVRSYNKKNLGLISNFNSGLSKCSGQIVVMMSGDDISLPNRVSDVCFEFSKSDKCMLVYSNYIRIDKNGYHMNGSRGKIHSSSFSHESCKEKIYAGSSVFGATAAYNLSIYKNFGNLSQGSYPEDRCYWLRALLMGYVRYISKPLVCWREHEYNLDNHIIEIDSLNSRKREVGKMRFRERYASQQAQDVYHALSMKLVSKNWADKLCKMIYVEKEKTRLRRYSMSPSPWRLWVFSACRLIHLDPSIFTVKKIIFSDFGIRYLYLKRESRWSKKFN